MKFCLLLIKLHFLLTNMAQAQLPGDATIYGFIQKVTPGIKEAERNFDEGTQTIKKVAKSNPVDYKIYFTLPGNVPVYFVEIWIQGQRYAVKAEFVEQTPVEYDVSLTSEQPRKVTLVPKTTQKVWLLTGLPATECKMEKTATLVKKAELVVVYRTSGKYYYKELKQFVPLSSIALQ